MVMLQSPFKIYINVIKMYTIISQGTLTNSTPWEEIMSFIYRTFAFQSVYIWNTVIQNINIHVPYDRFKHLLKKFLLSNDMSFRYEKWNHNLYPSTSLPVLYCLFSPNRYESIS